ncbi:HAD family phosphatase [Seonamhaeicola sp.]|uniref:HAD family hydrolase n=1 Tax=Seonamhaeicola sp. TaxID=1912245 RepID=UPI0026067EE3|nr:HAD family phosphatase [Seonamhaeicola sp.]
MIKALIFDFGNVFISLNEAYTLNYIKHFESSEHFNDIIETNLSYEKGLISTDAFLDAYKTYFPDQSKEDIIFKWNSILGDFPKHKLDFLKDLKENTNYKLILLSNTNELHMDWIKKHIPFYKDFKNCFDAFYLSYKIHRRKPDKAIFNFVLNKDQLKAEECLFIDDNKDNIRSANYLNIHTWHLNSKKDDVCNLFNVKSNLF